jgi:hypothetical protein
MNDEKKKPEGKRLDKALVTAGLSRADFVRLLNADERFKNVKSQDLNNWLNRGAPRKSLIDIQDVTGINFRWLKDGEEPIWLDGKNVTENLQKSDIESANVGEAIMLPRS